MKSSAPQPFGPDALAVLIDAYGRLEQRVRLQMEAHCRPLCQRCVRVCCRVDFCVESRQSAFLERVTARFAPGVRFDAHCGWLSANGCRLVAGRPPVCYEFVCAAITDTFDGVHRQHLTALGMLLTRVGRKAARGRHLVELAAADLGRIRTRRLLARIAVAHADLDAVAAIPPAHI